MNSEDRMKEVEVLLKLQGFRVDRSSWMSLNPNKCDACNRKATCFMYKEQGFGYRSGLRVRAVVWIVPRCNTHKAELIRREWIEL